MKTRINLLLLNSLSAIVQTVLYIVLIAVLYRYVIEKLGVGRLGLWTIVLSATSLAGLTNAGMSPSITKFISQYIAVGNMDKVKKTLHVAILLMTIMSIFISVLLYFGFYFSLPYFVNQPELVQEGRALLPFGFVSLLINSLTGVFQSCIDGLKKIYIRAAINIATTIFYVIFSIALINKNGIIGLAIAQIIQSALALLLSLFLLSRLLPHVSIFRLKWDKPTFKDIFRYSLRLQWITTLQLLTDPIMKLLLSKFGGIQASAFYDMALKLVNGLRTLIVAGIQSLIPHLAQLISIGNTKESLKVLRQSYQLVTFLSIIVFPSIMGFSLVISRIWLGYIEIDFVIILILVAFGIFSNSISIPVYFFNISAGHLRPNSIAALFSLLINLLLGLLLGWSIGKFGPVIAWGIGAVVGTVILKAMYSKSYRDSLSFFKWEDIKVMMLVLVASGLIFWLSAYQLEEHLVVTIIISACIYVAALYGSLYKDERIHLIIKKATVR